MMKGRTAPRSLVLGVGLVAALVVGLLTVKVIWTNEDSRVDDRPAHVPTDALWVGGADGGVYMLLQRVDSDPVGWMRGCIFFETTPSLEYQGAFEASGGGAVSLVDDPPTAWDGDTIHLESGRTLSARTPFTPNWDATGPERCDLSVVKVPE
ncbi:hypothetical protein F1188_00480 [Roseospira marina]|uniref:Uncharacterized protein n=1 Tax=Roseospira marina TaxID=140057 RepID=A0A5M6IG36_9PROT|nr:hypothetical protein [Roseospira marina]KAA5607281.1 hypothetical protein F1188_00480 [Roseospira marina]MBB4312564.1 hypothetical protein [Roseospira marina]MBB5085420.1 hypothetical protein [Roseospira marina]